MRHKLNGKKISVSYLIYIVAIIFISFFFVNKIFEKRFYIQFNSAINNARYFIATHTKHSPAKEEWLKNWKSAEGAWSQMNYLVHVPYLMFQYTPNIRSPYLNTNDMGFRGTENYSYLPSMKVDRNYRYVVLLGGSAAFGAFSTSDEKCISGQLEKLLNENFNSKKHFKVINLSAGFYNSFQELTAYIIFGLKFKPEAVITFDGFNDASVSSSTHEGKHVPLVSGNYYYTKEVLDKINEFSIKTRHKQSFLSQENKATMWDKESKYFVTDVAELYRQDLDLICHLSEQNNTKVILTLQPIQVLKNGHLAWRHSREELEQIYSILPDNIKEVAGKYKAEYIDFQAIFSKNPEYNDYFSHLDPVHLIDKGQEIVARQVFEKLKNILSHD